MGAASLISKWMGPCYAVLSQTPRLSLSSSLSLSVSLPLSPARRLSFSLSLVVSLCFIAGAMTHGRTAAHSSTYSYFLPPPAVPGNNSTMYYTQRGETFKLPTIPDRLGPSFWVDAAKIKSAVHHRSVVPKQPPKFPVGACSVFRQSFGSPSSYFLSPALRRECGGNLVKQCSV